MLGTLLNLLSWLGLPAPQASEAQFATRHCHCSKCVSQTKQWLVEDVRHYDIKASVVILQFGKGGRGSEKNTWRVNAFNACNESVLQRLIVNQSSIL